MGVGAKVGAAGVVTAWSVARSIWRRTRWGLCEGGHRRERGRPTLFKCPSWKDFVGFLGLGTL